MDPARLPDPSDAAAWLREAGLRATPQRLAIARELAGDRSHPTAQELFDRLRPRMPTMSFATVYNTLSALSARGLCAARVLSPGATRFDPITEPHHHAVCEACGAVLDVPAEPALVSLPAVPGFRVRAVEQVLRGVCEGCEPTGRRLASRPPAP